MCLFPSGLKVSCQRCTEIHSSVNIWTKVRDQCIKPNGYWAYLSILTSPQFTPHIIYIYIHICTKTHRHMQMETYSTERPRTFCTYMTHKITRGHMYAKWQTYITHGHIYKTCRDLKGRIGNCPHGHRSNMHTRRTECGCTMHKDIHICTRAHKCTHTIRECTCMNTCNTSVFIETEYYNDAIF